MQPISLSPCQCLVSSVVFKYPNPNLQIQYSISFFGKLYLDLDCIYGVQNKIGFGLYLCNLEYWIYICLYLDLKVFGLNLMNQLNWIASVYYLWTVMRCPLEFIWRPIVHISTVSNCSADCWVIHGGLHGILHLFEHWSLPLKYSITSFKGC